MEQKIKSFTDLIAWQEGHLLVVAIYQTIKTFPSTEKFGLSSQIARAAVSITSNIAEGFSRQSSKEKIYFYYNSLGSLTEIQNQLVIARDIGLMNQKTFYPLAEKTIKVQKLIHGLINHCKNSN